MLKRKWDAECNGKLLHLFIPSKTATLVPEFTVEDLPLDRTATLVPSFAVKDLPLDRTPLMKMILKEGATFHWDFRISDQVDNRAGTDI